MNDASIKWFALWLAAASTLGGCGSLRQGESTSRCTDCATALSRDSDGGGSIYSIVSQGDAAVWRVASRYCSEHGLGQPTVGPRRASPIGADFREYDFSCAASETAPAAQRPAVAQAAQPAAPSLQQVRQQRREQAVSAMRQALQSLSCQPAQPCESPVTMTVKLPWGEVVSCSKTDEQVGCD